MRPEILLGTEIHKGRDPVILIIDPDLGRVCWLGQLLSQAGCQVIPALSSREAVRLVVELNLPIDLAIVDPGIRGISKVMRTIGSTSSGRLQSGQPARMRLRQSPPKHR